MLLDFRKRSYRTRKTIIVKGAGTVILKLFLGNASLLKGPSEDKVTCY